MSDEIKKMNEEELLQSTGGAIGLDLASQSGRPVLKVKNPAAGSVSLKSSPSSDSTDIAQLKNGDVVQAVGGRIQTGDDGSGKKVVTYTRVYVPSLKQDGWVDSAFLG